MSVVSTLSLRLRLLTPFSISISSTPQSEPLKMRPLKCRNDISFYFRYFGPSIALLSGIVRSLVKIFAFLIVQTLFFSSSAWSAVIGNIDGVAMDTKGNASINGWACLQNSASSLTVHVYAGDTYPRGQFVTYGAANLSNEPAVSKACGTGSSRYRFVLPLSQGHRVQFNGKKLYAYGKASSGVQGLLAGSGIRSVPAATQFSSCQVSDLTSLKNCMNTLYRFQILNFVADVTCTGASCCGADGHSALMDFSRTSYKVISGNNHVLTRRGSQKVCPAIEMSGSSYIWISSLSIDEDENAKPCGAYDNCANTIYSHSGSNILIENTKIYNSKSIGVYLMVE